MTDSIVQLSLEEFLSQLDDRAEEELTWYGAEQVTFLQGGGVGSKEFIENYDSFTQALKYSSSHKIFLATVALTATENIIKTELVAVPEGLSSEQRKNYIIDIANTYYASLSYVLVLTKAVGGEFLAKNETCENIADASLVFNFGNS